MPNKYLAATHSTNSANTRSARTFYSCKTSHLRAHKRIALPTHPLSPPSNVQHAIRYPHITRNKKGHIRMYAPKFKHVQFLRNRASTSFLHAYVWLQKFMGKGFACLTSMDCGYTTELAPSVTFLCAASLQPMGQPANEVSAKSRSNGAT